MQHSKIRQLLQFVSTPVTKIQWTGRTHFKRVAACNMLQVQLRTSLDQPFHGAHIPVYQIIRLFFQPFKKSSIFYQGHFDSFRNTAAPIAFIQRSKKMCIVENSSRRSECAQEIFFAEKIDSIFYTDTRIVLGQHGCWNTDMTYSPVSNSRGITCNIQ